MNLLFCAAPKDVYAFLTTEAYPAAFAPFSPVVAQCTDENERAAVRATHARDKKTRDPTEHSTSHMRVYLPDFGEELIQSYIPPHTN